MWAELLGGLLSPDNSISFRGPIVFSNILIGRALCFAFVQSVIKFPRGFSTRPPPPFRVVRNFTLSGKYSLGCSRLINKLCSLFLLLSPLSCLSHLLASTCSFLIKVQGTSSGRSLVSEEFLSLELGYLRDVLLGRKWWPGTWCSHLSPPPASALASKSESPHGGHRPCGNSSATLPVIFYSWRSRLPVLVEVWGDS